MALFSTLVVSVEVTAAVGVSGVAVACGFGGLGGAGLMSVPASAVTVMVVVAAGVTSRVPFWLA
jgi:hypothetical protein